MYALFTTMALCVCVACRRMSEAMELMNREMNDMMNAFGVGGFMRPFAMLDRFTDFERPLMELNTGR